MNEPIPYFNLILNDGRNIAVQSGQCHSCENEFFFHSHREFLPSYCPYCGIKFVRCEGPLIPEPDD